MNRPGNSPAIHLIIILIIFFSISCREKVSLNVSQISPDPEVQTQYNNFLIVLNEEYNPANMQVYLQFNKMESVLEKEGLLLLYSRMGEYFYKFEQADSALEYFSKGRETAIETRNEYYTAYFHLKCGEALTFLSDFDPALNELKKAYSLSLALDSSQLQIRSARILGNAYWNKGEFDLALTYYYNSLDLSKVADDSEGISAALNNIGIIYHEVQDFEKAISFYKQSEIFALKTNSVRLLSSSYNNVGEVFSMKKEYDSALVYFKRALSYLRIEDSKYYAGIYLGNIADVYLKKDSLDQAKEFFLKSLALADEISDKIGIASCNLGLADISLHEGDLIQTRENLTTGTLICEEIGSFKLLDYAYELNARYYNLKNDFPGANMFLLKQLAVRDSFAAHENDENVVRLENRYKEVQNIREIEMLKEKQKSSMKLLILGFSAFVIVLVVIFIAYQQKVRSNLLLNDKNKQIESSKQILEEKHQQLLKSQEQLSKINKGKDVFLTIISHDIKNPLSAIRGFTELLVKNYDDLSDEKRKLFLNEVYDSIERITLLINNVLYWVKSQSDEIQYNPVRFELSKRIDENIALYRLAMNKKEIRLETKITDKIFVYADINVFDMIIRNILSNALKFSRPKGKIAISAQVTGSKLRLSVSDSGIGIPEDKLKIILSRKEQYSTVGTNHEQGTGLGIDLIYRFVEQSGGDFDIQSEPDKGTTISITLDLAMA